MLLCSSHCSIIVQPLSIFRLISSDTLAQLSSSFQPHCSIVSSSFYHSSAYSTDVLLFFTPLFLLKYVYFFLCASDGECSIAAQMQVSAKQTLFSLSFLCMHGQQWSSVLQPPSYIHNCSFYTNPTLLPSLNSKFRIAIVCRPFRN